jgi:hypothetical protein
MRERLITEMTSLENGMTARRLRGTWLVLWSLVALGLGGFVIQLLGSHPERAWQAYLINFLLWSAVAQGALLFSAVMHITKARWSRPLEGLAESFAAFFPISLALFVLLFLGRDYVFPWAHEAIPGKEHWLNMPFLFTRDLVGLLILYGLGWAYVSQALALRGTDKQAKGGLSAVVLKWFASGQSDRERDLRRLSVLGVLYILAYALVLSLLAFDLLMSMDPYWISTLFGAYSFVKAFYVGLGALIILAAILSVRHGEAMGITPSHFHNLGKLFFAFGLLWADFFYCQLVVIWYGNISEETGYVIARTMVQPWKSLAWTVFVVCFIAPFLILLNRRIKMKPRVMLILAAFVLAGIWLEHLLLVGPALNPHATTMPLGIVDGLISLGFFGLMAMAVTYYFNAFPGLVPEGKRGSG